jgi:Ca-activated chloride channel family protein
MTRRLTAALAGTAGAALVALAAAAPRLAAAPAQQVFRGGTDLVFLSVTVQTPTGQLISGLSRADFQILEDGIPQTITNFAQDPQPIALSLVLDSSMSMERKLPVAQQAAINFARRLGRRDLAQVIDFDSRPVVQQGFTSDVELLERAIRATHSGGSTALYDALYVALDELRGVRAGAAGEEIRRSAIVILSDGEDTSSLNSYEDVLELARRAEVIVYAIGLRAKEDGPRRGFNQAEYVLRSLAQQTGGRSFFVDDIAQLAGLYSQIADELSQQYSLGYASANAKRDGAWRRVHVRVTRTDAVARTRAGYFAPKPRR